MEHVQAGVTHLQAAKQLQKNTRKWMCCALITLLIVVAVRPRQDKADHSLQFLWEVHA